MPEPNIVGAPTANQHLQFGINTIADLLTPTFGPIGGLVVNQSELGRPELLDDSATIVRRIIDLGSPARNIGTMLMRNLVWRVDQQVGDGGAMAAILARAIYNDAWRLVTAGANPVMLAHGMDQAVPLVLAALDQQSRPLATEDELAAFALTFTRDKPLAAVLAEMSYLLGPDAHVVIETYGGTLLERQYVAGARYPAQIASPYLYTDPAHKRATIADTLLAIVDQELNEADEVVPLLDAAAQAGKNLAIIATGASEAVLGVLIANQRAERKGEVTSPLFLAAKLTTLGEEHRLALADLARLTGAHVLGRNYERTPAHAQPDDLGRARRVEVNENAVIVETDAHARPAVQDEAQRLRRYLAGLPLKAEERPLLIKRLATLSGGVGELKIGAISKTELETRRTLAERAFKVLASAQRSGVVAGGGAALMHGLPALQSLRLDGDEKLGVQILARALPAPLRQILHNAHADKPEWIVQQICEAGPPATFDVFSRRVVDAHRAGILDAVHIVKAVFQIAVSGALMALKTDTIVYHRKPKESEGLEP